MGNFLIFGGSGGIGSAIARRLTAGGHDLVLAGRNAGAMEALSAEIGGRTHVCDLSEEGAAEGAVSAAGPVLHGLVYAIGTINLKPFGRLSRADFLADFGVNALGAALALQAAAPALVRAGETGPSPASVLLFSTVAVSQGFPAHASIAMAKGAVEGLTVSLAAELAPHVRVNAIAPSLVETPLGRRVAGTDKMAEALGRMHPLARLGTPDDIAALAELLLTPAGDWITGQVIGVDGGRSRLKGPRG